MSIKCVKITRDNREYQCGDRTFMATRTAPGGVRTDWSIIEIDGQRHGYLFRPCYKTGELESAVLQACHVEVSHEN